MKSNINFFLLIAASIVFFASCDKVGKLPFYKNGNAPALTSSTATIVAAPADSLSSVLTLNWTNPQYSTDSGTEKYVIEFDSSGRNFAHQVTTTVSGSLTASFTAKQLNDILAGFGFNPGQPFSIDVRVISSYANNNEQYASNTITIAITPYEIPVTLTPSSTNPLILQINNASDNAISFDWNASPYGNYNIYYALQIDVEGDNFANPQTIKYNTSLNSSISVNDLNNAAISAGVLGGTSKNVEFRIVSYIGTDYTKVLGYSNVVSINITTYVPVPPNLYIIGDATPENPQWDNSTNLIPFQQFIKVDAVSYSIKIYLTAGKSYLFLPVEGSWDHKYGGATDGTGSPANLLSDAAIPGSNTPAPSTSGLYEIVVNFQTNKFTVTPATPDIVPPSQNTLFIVGDATPQGWSNPLTNPSAQQFTQINPYEYELTLSFVGGGGYKLIGVNGAWNEQWSIAVQHDPNETYGGAFVSNGADCGGPPPGTYKITVNFADGLFTLVQQ